MAKNKGGELTKCQIMEIQDATYIKTEDQTRADQEAVIRAL